VREVSGEELPLPEITGWIRAVKERFQAGERDGVEGNGHSHLRVGLPYLLETEKNRRAVMREYLSIVSAALDLGIIPGAILRM